MEQKKTNGLRTWIEVDRNRLKHNYLTFRKLIGNSCQLMAVCKSNAYGHSLIDFSTEVEKLGVDWLGLDSILEALKLRTNGLTKPMLVLGYTLPEMIKEAVDNNISITVSSFEALKILSETPSDNLKIHLKFDTGMCRQGFFPEDAEAVLDYCTANLPKVVIEGVYTHFAGAKNPAFPKGTKEQMVKFALVLEAFVKRGLKPIRHAAATSGTIVFGESHFDMVRIGIGLYDSWPSKEVEYAYSDKFELQPILTWKTVVAEIKLVPAGSRVGYDFTELLERPTILGILPVGYWHGYDRSLSSIGKVLVAGHRARVLGRVSMDMIIVDLTDIKNIKVGDEVVLIGEQNGATMSAEEMASLADTSSYEIITRLNPLIKRFYI
jgi:alanine racemase